MVTSDPGAGMAPSRGADVDGVLDEIVRRLLAAYRPERVYLFGSRTRADATAESDYDLLLVVGSSSEPMHRRARVGYAALHGVPAAVDVLVWTRAEFDGRLSVVTSLPATVVREGRLLHAA
jgi:predicted nucleotidyltransferase